MEATLTWMALMARKDKGCMAVRREVAAAGDPLEAWRRWEERHRIEAREAMVLASQQMDRVLEAGAEVVTCQDVRYPPMLANIPDAPPVVYSRGRWPLEWGRALSVVGTRTCTRQGAEWAMQAGREWTEAGGLLVSGLARGIDGRAHHGALQSSHGGQQVAVLPCSLDRVHPRMHESLAEDIVDRGGLLVTEQPPGAQVERWMFASRNRILTGLSATTVVIQSPARGGSLISARCAFDQNRSLYTLWNRDLKGPSWSGNRALVADNMAQPVTDIDDLWRHVGAEAEVRIAGIKMKNAAGLPTGCGKVWSELHSDRATTWRALHRSLRLAETELNRQLFTLESQGWIRRLPGRAYLRC
jgi:DNA processing protein